MRLSMKPMAAVGVLMFLVAACGGTSDDTQAETTAAPAPETTAAAGPETTAAPTEAGLSGTIAISGSSTVEPISARVGQAFDTANPGVSTTVEGPGTGDGFARFCNGETDISDASRPIKDEEAEACAAAGVEYVELHVATDGLTVMTNPANGAITCLNYGDLYALTGPESEGFELWSDANALAAEVGGTGGFPDAPLVLVGPGEESGTYDTYVELVIADLAEERGQEEFTRADYEASANDNVIVQGITGNDTSLGWVGYAFFEENQAVLKALEVDGGDGCVAPTAETIASFEYPLSRPLFIYVKTNDLAANPALVAFVDYYLSDEGLGAVAEAGYVQLPAPETEETRSAWTSVRP